MAFTKRGEHVQLDKGNGSLEPYYFHPVDITKVIMQGATALEITNAIITLNDETVFESKVIIGLTNQNTSGGGDRIADTGAIIALACTPFVDQEGGMEILP